MRLIVFVAIIAIMDGCRIYRRIPENGTASSTRYSVVFRSELEYEEQFVNGRSVKTVAYHKNGRKAIETIASGQDSARIRTEYFFPNGQKMRETLFISDTLIAENVWYDDGMLRLNFILGADNKQRVQQWHINGIKSEESEWMGNNRNGKFVHWDSTGRRIRNERYRNGVKIEHDAP